MIIDILYQTVVLTSSITLILLILGVIGILWKNGYIQNMPYYTELRNAIIMQGLNSVANANLTGMLLPSNSNLSKSELSNFQLDEDKQYAYGEIIFNGKKYMLFLPYDHGLARRMRMRSTYLLSGKSRVNVSHPPGIPHSISAKQLGGNSLIICDDMDDIFEEVKDDQKLTYKFD